MMGFSLIEFREDTNPVLGYKKGLPFAGRPLFHKKYNHIG